MNSSLRLGSALASTSSLRFALVSLLALGFASGCGRAAQIIGDDMSGVSTAGDSDGSGGGTVDNGGADAVTGSTPGSGGATLAEGGVGNASLGGSASGGFSTGGDTQGSGGWSEGGTSQGNAEPGGGASQGGVSQGGGEPGGGASQGGVSTVGGANQGGFQSGGTGSGGASSGGATSDDCGCGEDQFCNRESCEADASGECTDKPEGCLTDVQPVCGCDGKTYSNGCERLRAGVSLDHTGECEVDPCGGCNDEERCIYQLGGPGPSHYACAPQLPCGSNEECACITGQGTCDVSATDPTLCECENGLD